MPFGKRYPAIVTRMQYKRGTADLGHLIRDIHGIEAADQADGIFWRGRKPLHFGEPAILLRFALRNKQSRINLAECGILVAPAELDEFEHGVGFVDGLGRRIALEPSSRERAVEDQMADAIRVARRVGDRQPSPLTASKKDKLLQSGGLDDRFQIA